MELGASCFGLVVNATSHLDEEGFEVFFRTACQLGGPSYVRQVDLEELGAHMKDGFERDQFR